MSIRTALHTPPSSTAATPPLDTVSLIELTVALLGGPRVLHRKVQSDEDAHDLVLHGIPAPAMARVFGAVLTLTVPDLLAAVGVSERSFARRKATPQARLPLDESERLWRFAEILAQATRVFGTQAEAELWLERPTMSLNRQKPIQLLRTHPGARLVAQQLTRIEHGVYT
jgi:putative toxin-antitoxin system antitoxin component (TIGR02293 family)